MKEALSTEMGGWGFAGDGFTNLCFRRKAEKRHFTCSGNLPFCVSVMAGGGREGEEKVARQKAGERDERPGGGGGKADGDFGGTRGEKEGVKGRKTRREETPFYCVGIMCKYTPGDGLKKASC